MSKRIYKLQEIPYSEGKLLCAKIGRKSGRVLVTGGEDKKVNMWAIGKQECIMSLSGHTTPVECVAFDSQEEYVAAGSSGGTLKLWDLDQQKVVRTLNGHKANCISVDFHPFGDFFASGSLDTDLKVWDVRKKDCIQTYKGHAKGVNAVHFSPDGRWVISGGDDGLVKLWDLTAGKLIHDFDAHKGPISTVEFHPHEFLLATGSTDRTVKFWDLETFSLVCSTDIESAPVRALSFYSEANCLFAAYTNTLRCWGWEPIRCYDAVDVDWKDIYDIHIAKEQLVCCSISPSSSISVWMLNPQKMQPLAKDKMITGSPVRGSLEMNNSKTSEALIQIQKSINDQPKKEDNALSSKAFPVTIPEVPKPVKEDRVMHLEKQESQRNDVINELMSSHTTLCSILSLRLAHVKVVRNFWAKNDAREAIEILAKLNDVSVSVDILNVILSSDKSSILTLDVCVSLLPVLEEILSSSYPEHVLTALRVLLLLATSFGSVIKSALEVVPSHAVDISREERIEKCKLCHSRFSVIKTKLETSTSPVFSTPKGSHSRKEVLLYLKGFVS